MYKWESIISIPSPITSHFSGCCCECTLSMFTPISPPLLYYWIGTSSCGCCLSLWLWSIGSWHTWHSRHTYYWLSAFYIKSCIIWLCVNSWEKAGRSLWNSLGYAYGLESLGTLIARKHPDDKGLSLYWYAIKTRAVAGYQWMWESYHLYKITWMTLVHQQDVYRP